MDAHGKIVDILASFLGDYGKESGGWYSFDCPCCAEEKFVDHDGKYNLEVYVDPDAKGCGGFHCWRCGEYSGMKGTVSALVRRYGGEVASEEYRRVRDEYRESRKYDMSFSADEHEIDEDDEVMLPEGFKPLTKDAEGGSEAYDYVIGRGLDDRIIKRYHIGFVGKDCDKKSICERVYFPSYDFFGALNYWTGRDYTGKNKQKSKNPKRSKSTIVFNEGLVNWYEPITLVEGPFDHVVTPNSIPLLGKVMDADSAVYKALVERARNIIRIFLDDDAKREALKIYSLLSRSRLNGGVRLIEGTNGHDPSDIYKERGSRGILETLCTAREVKDYELIFGG